MNSKVKEFYDDLYEDGTTEETRETINVVKEDTTELIEKFREGDCDYHATMVTMLTTIFEYVRNHTCGGEECGVFIIKSSFKLAEAIAEAEENTLQ